MIQDECANFHRTLGSPSSFFYFIFYFSVIQYLMNMVVVVMIWVLRGGPLGLFVLSSLSSWSSSESSSSSSRAVSARATVQEEQAM